MDSDLSKARKELILAAFLHDVGKFYNFKTSSDHALNSKQLLKRVLEGKNQENIESRFGLDFSKVMNLVENHHKKKGEEILLFLLKKADKYSAKERGEEIVEEREERIKTMSEHNVNFINSTNKESSGFFGEKLFIKPQRVSQLLRDLEKSNEKLSQKIITNEENEEIVRAYYSEENWINLEKLFSIVLEASDFNTFLTNLNVILFDFLKFIPSSVLEEKGKAISLYDHSKLTAAIASCLDLSNKEKEEVTLISVDIGNIQSFISKAYNYERASEHATRRIRGRSFMVSFLCNLLSIYLIERLKLPITNILISSAGKVLILSKKLEESEREGIKKEIEKFFIEELKGELTVAISYNDEPVEKLVEKFEEVLREIEDNLRKEKSRRFSSAIDKIVDFNEREKGKMVCEICGNTIDEKDQDEKCKTCKMLEEIGNEIVKKDGIAIFKEKYLNMEEGKTWKYKIGDKTYYFKPLDIKDIEKEKPEYFLFFFIKLPDILEKENKVLKKTKLIPFFEYSYVPLDNENRILPIEKEENKESEDRISILDNVKIRIFSQEKKISFNKIMVSFFDVDNLGKLFLGRKYIICYKSDNKLVNIEVEYKNFSISEWSTLSFNIHFFFNVINYYLARKWNIYTIYSGGDDMKVFGSPYEVLMYILEFLDEFYFYFNGKISISGGILMNNSKVPIFRSIMLVESLEKEAKKVGHKGNMAFLNKKYIFPSLYSTQSIRDIWSELENIVENKLLSSSSLFNIFQIAKSHLDSGKVPSKGEKVYIGYSRIEYMLKRNWNGDDYSYMLDKLFKNIILEKIRAIFLFVPIFSIFYTILKEVERR